MRNLPPALYLTTAVLFVKAILVVTFLSSSLVFSPAASDEPDKPSPEVLDWQEILQKSREDLQKSREDLQKSRADLHNYFLCKQSLSNKDCNPKLLTPEVLQLFQNIENLRIKRENIARANNSSVPSGCYQSTIQTPSPFLGNNGEVFALADGSVGEIFAEYEYMYEYFPSVIACWDNGFIIVDDEKLNVKFLSNTCLESIITKPQQFRGDTGEVFVLLDGSVGEVLWGAFGFISGFSKNVIACWDEGFMVFDGKKLSVQKIK